MQEGPETRESLVPPPGWAAEGDRIARTFKFRSFPEALAFMVEVGLFCEATSHHPDWTNVYNRVAVALTTHDSGRVTEKDIALARHMDAVYARGREAAPSM